jgi:hypothetical protein
MAAIHRWDAYKIYIQLYLRLQREHPQLMQQQALIVFNLEKTISRCADEQVKWGLGLLTNFN